VKYFLGGRAVPALVNDFHFGVNKLLSNNLNYWITNNLKNAGTSLGIPGFNFDTQYSNPGIPVITFGQVAGQVSYTWSHALDPSTDSNGGGTLSQQYNPAADYGSSNWDVRNRVVGVITYTLPTFSGSNLLVREAVGGWEVNRLVNVQSGQPINVALNYNSAGLSEGTQRPNFVHAPHANCSLKNYIQDTSCVDSTAYTLPANISTGDYAFGNTSRNTLHGPGFSYENVSIFKNFPIWERVMFQFRAEAFNAFNHPSAGNPNVTFGHNTSPVAEPTFNGFGYVTSVSQIPGSLTAARVLSLSGKVIW
jgi:hypothetical protein